MTLTKFVECSLIFALHFAAYKSLKLTNMKNHKTKKKETGNVIVHTITILIIEIKK